LRRPAPTLRPARQATRALCAAPITVRPVHLLLYSYVDDVLEAREPFRAGHVGLARAAAKRGELLLGGALADPVDGAILAFTTNEAVEQFVKADPYVTNGIVTSWDVRQWSVVVGSLDVPPVPPFVPAYEWQRVEAGAELPPGLDVELPLDGGHQRARIPPEWQLQIFVGDAHGYLRLPVSRSTTAGEVRAAAASKASVPISQISLTVGGNQVDDNETIEGLQLFSKTKEVALNVRGNDPSP